MIQVQGFNLLLCSEGFQTPPIHVYPQTSGIQAVKVVYLASESLCNTVSDRPSDFTIEQLLYKYTCIHAG